MTGALRVKSWGNWRRSTLSLRVSCGKVMVRQRPDKDRLLGKNGLFTGTRKLFWMACPIVKQPLHRCPPRQRELWEATPQLRSPSTGSLDALSRRRWSKTSLRGWRGTSRSESWTPSTFAMSSFGETLTGVTGVILRPKAGSLALASSRKNILRSPGATSGRRSMWKTPRLKNLMLRRLRADDADAKPSLRPVDYPRPGRANSCLYTGVHPASIAETLNLATGCMVTYVVRHPDSRCLS